MGSNPIRVICLWFFVHGARESTEYTVLTHIGVRFKPEFINTSNSFAIPIGGERVTWVCIILCLWPRQNYLRFSWTSNQQLQERGKLRLHRLQNVENALNVLKKRKVSDIWDWSLSGLASYVYTCKLHLTANLQNHESHVKWCKVKGDNVRGFNSRCLA